MADLRFDGRVAVVTGAGRGVGRSHAMLLAERGASVVVADYGVDVDGTGSSSAPAEDVVRQINSLGGNAVSCFASVADEQSAAAIVHTAIDAFGRVDVVVNNAGIHDAAPFEELSTKQFETMLRVHCLGSVFVTRAAWPHFIEAGYGRVVNTVSEGMLGGLPQLSSYGTAKGAVFGLTRNLATEGAAHGIRVNAIAPRANTRLADDGAHLVTQHMGIPKETMEQVKSSMPPELCAPAAVFLAHESCPLNGEVFVVGMGQVARLATVRTKGVFNSAVTAEDIAKNLDAIMDVTDAVVTTVAGMTQ